jgi:hypothetical protein
MDCYNRRKNARNDKKKLSQILGIMLEYVERKKEIPYKEGRMKEIDAHVGYTILWGKERRWY